MEVHPHSIGDLDPRVHSDLAAQCVYGPVPSRRYGVTLGLNLSPPGEKRCSLRCTYCQIGPETLPKRAVEFASAADLLAQVEHAAVLAELPIAAWVLSGNGEATLHPEFALIVAKLRELRGRVAAGTPLVLLTSGTELIRPEIRAACATLDEVAVKLDAGTQQLYERLNMPWDPLSCAAVADAARQLPNVVAQALLVQGSVDNTTDLEVSAWMGLVRRMSPRRVDLYTLARPPIERGLLPASAEAMSAVAQRLRDRGVQVRVFGQGLDD